MTAPTRTRLPDRRPSVRRRIEAGGIEALLTIGFDWRDGRVAPREIFIDPPPGLAPGSVVEALLRDASAAVSVALQYRVPLDALRKTLSREGSPGEIGGLSDAPGSLICAALDAIAEETT